MTNRLSEFAPLSVFLAGVLGLGAPASAADDKKSPTEPRLHEVEAVKDLAYYEGKDADDKKHKLDLFLPKGLKDFPVLFFVHGGAWHTGDRNYLGVYSSLGRFYAKHGLGTVVISYRLSPQVTHPEHIKDVARAFAWTHKNIGKYGGRNDRIFACGHSAGGHLVALLGTDESYLKAEGLDTTALRGVIPISGVYNIPDGFLQKAFGKDAETRRLAGPIVHAKSNLPPFLILWADKDIPGCGRTTSEAFAAALKAKDNSVGTCEIKESNHIMIILSAFAEDSPVSKAILNFVAERTK
jgi:acetyl esterase/lipase